jgi:hypothetical protein
MTDQTNKLLQIKAHVDKCKTEAARLGGQIEQLQKQRAEEFGCATDEEADIYIKELEADVSRLEVEIEEGIQTIREELNW